MANYHPSNELLMQFAAGQASNALGIMVACHLESCSACRHQVRLYDQIGGELLNIGEPIAVSDKLLNITLDRLDEPFNETVVPPSREQRLPRPLHRFVASTFEDIPWRGMSKNIKEYTLPISDGTYTAKFYKIAAGKELPNHTHRGNEYTLVMDGSFSDTAGSYHQGDFILADTQIIHQPKAHDDCDCICFAVMDAPLKLTGFWGKMLNPFLS